MKLRDHVKTPEGKNVAIDTCWTFDHGYETMVFSCDENGNVTNWFDLDSDLYGSEKEAIEGHKAMVNKWKNYNE